jgi:hypothetical protein
VYLHQNEAQQEIDNDCSWRPRYKKSDEIPFKHIETKCHAPEDLKRHQTSEKSELF